MPAKIISKKPSPNVAKQCVCPNCGVKLEYVPMDTRKQGRTDYTGDTDYYRVLDCPNCKHVITLGAA